MVNFFVCYDNAVKFAAFLLLSAVALAQSSSSKPARPAPHPAPAPKSAPAEPQSPAPDDGSINGQLYTSEYFSFAYTLPAHLEVNDDFMAGQEDATGQTFVLLAAYGPAPEAGRREGVVLMADRIDVSSSRDGDAWAAAYLQELSRVLVAQGGEPVGAIREYSFGGQKFFRADFKRNGPDPGFQSLLVTLRRGYVLGFDFVAASESQADKLVESLNSIRFAPLAAPPSPRRAPAPTPN